MKKLIMLIFVALFVASIVFTAQGVDLHQKVVVEEAKLNQLQEDYYTVAKSDRDVAATDSDLNQKRALIEQFPSELDNLREIGSAKILMGIYFLLFGILIALIVLPYQLSHSSKRRK